MVYLFFKPDTTTKIDIDESISMLKVNSTFSFGELNKQIVFDSVHFIEPYDQLRNINIEISPEDKALIAATNIFDQQQPILYTYENRFVAYSYSENYFERTHGCVYSKDSKFQIILMDSIHQYKKIVPLDSIKRISN